jgi:ribosome biogenesis GTPase / thiamine phosphate phosphatase
VTEPNDITTLAELGWDAHFESSLAEAEPGWIALRVVGEERGMWRVQGLGTGVVWGEIPGKWRKDAETRLDFPAVGDWVLAEPIRSDGRTFLRKILPRKSCLVRRAAGTGEEPQVLAANVDIAFLVTSLNSDLNPRRLERYLALVWDGGARPVILLTKSDLVGESTAVLSQVEAVAPGVEIVTLSAKTGQNLEAVRNFLSPGRTIVVLGSSGVGKSTLINKLLGREKLKVQDIRADDKGRHTTTARSLLRIPSGGLIIDTPGMRELHLWDQEEGLQALFSEVEEIALGCRFTNCGHQTEPSCAVRTALQEGRLSKDRFDSYQKLRKELAADSRKYDKGAAADAKKKSKVMTTALRRHVKSKKTNEPPK